MAQLTAEKLSAITAHADCTPLLESIVNQGEIASIWVHATGLEVAYEVNFNDQFVGVMHQGTDHESVWTEEHCGWIEDGKARKGVVTFAAGFDTFEEAFDCMNSRIKERLIAAYGSLSNLPNAV